MQIALQAPSYAAERPDELQPSQSDGIIAINKMRKVRTGTSFPALCGMSFPFRVVSAIAVVPVGVGVFAGGGGVGLMFEM